MIEHGMIVRFPGAVQVVDVQGDEVTFWSVTALYENAPVGVRMKKWQGELRVNEPAAEVLTAIPWVSFVDTEGQRWHGVLLQGREKWSGTDYCRVRVHAKCGPDADGAVGRLAYVPASRVKQEATAPFPEITDGLLRLCREVA